MKPVDVLARVLTFLFRALRVLGVPAAKALPPGEIPGNAHGLSAAILGSRWDKAQKAPDWKKVSSTWSASLVSISGVDPTLHGLFDPTDRLELITDNAEAFRLRARLLAEATRSIDLATYYIQGDETGRAFARGLIDAAKRGVKVRLTADAYVMEKKEFEGKGASALVAELRAAGVEVVMWRDPARPYDAQHRKVLVIDDRHVLIGGRNIADHYAGPEWRDVELFLSGPSAAKASALVDRTIKGEPEPPRAPGTLFVATTPGDVLSHANFLYLLQCVRNAKTSVDIENAYYFSHDAVLEELAQAKKRGVRVRVMTNSAETNDLDYANYRLYSGFPAMLDAGIEIHLRRGKGRTLHCKYFVIDGEWVSIGSSNFDYYSPRHSTEANVQVRSRRLGEKLVAWFDTGLPDADRIEDRAAIDAHLQTMGIGKTFDRWLKDFQ